MESMYFRSTQSSDTPTQGNPSWDARKAGVVEFSQEREITLFDIVECQLAAARARKGRQSQRDRAQGASLKQPIGFTLAALAAIRREKRLDAAFAQHAR